MKKNHPAPSPSVDELRRFFEQKILENQNSQALDATVNKPPREQRPSQQTKPESLYATVNKPRREKSPPNPPETICAPQKALETDYVVPPDVQHPTKLVAPYLITDLEKEGWLDSESRENPLYDGVGRWAHRRRHPQEPEHIYAELDFGANDSHSPHNPVENGYATVGMGAHGGQDFQQRENPIYEGLNTGRIMRPPMTPKDEVTSKLLKNVDFQYGVREVQEWCKVVYGNEHALNKQLAKILDNPQQGEAISREVAADPEGIGKLAGQKVLGMKSPSRKEAEAAFIPLCAALDRHVKTAKKLHKHFTREHSRHKNLERAQKHHHHHRTREERQNSLQREEQQRCRHGEEKGMAFWM
ncbi:BID domain-containing T4SS effector [Bartonella gliris]|uniref:BID domain-containing T4SS effector n=1 Tax=Bartonella gliris TaxID=3004109 RepID=UPI00295E7EDC|nr:BID domain-containing T4SS effector [Bartonella gliris]